MSSQESELKANGLIMDNETLDICAVEKHLAERAIDNAIYSRLIRATEEHDSFIFKWQHRPMTTEENGLFRVKCCFAIEKG